MTGGMGLRRPRLRVEGVVGCVGSVGRTWVTGEGTVWVVRRDGELEDAAERWERATVLGGLTALGGLTVLGGRGAVPC